MKLLKRMKPSKKQFLAEIQKSNPKKYAFEKLTQMESRLSTLIDLADEADGLVENIEDATIAWENQIYKAKEYYNGEIFDEIESVRATFEELGVNIDDTNFGFVSEAAEQLNDKLSSALGKDLFVVTREIKNQFS